MADSRELVDRVKRATDLCALVQALTQTQLKPQSHQFVGLCPLHNEKTPSFTIDPKKGVYHCFGCGKGGDAFQFVMDLRGVPFQEALHELAERAQITLPQHARRASNTRLGTPAPAPAPSAQQKEAERLAAADAAKRIRRAVALWDKAHDPSDSPAALYVRQTRFVWPPDMDLPTTLRWLPQASLPYTAPTDAAGALLWQFVAPDATHCATGLEGLTVAGAHTTPRYRRTFGSAKHALFHVAGGDGVLQLCEGPVDALAARWLGGGPSVATGGTSGLKALTPSILPGVAAVHFHVDADDAGQAAAAIAAQALLSAGITVTGTLYQGASERDPAAYLAALLRAQHGDWGALPLPLT